MSCESYKITTVEVLGMLNNWESFGLPKMPTWVLSSLCLSSQVITVKTCVQAALLGSKSWLRGIYTPIAFSRSQVAGVQTSPCILLHGY